MNNSRIQLLPAAARLAVPWKNGGGITREVARDAQSGAGEGFRWRVSIAEVSSEGAFSTFTGCRRWIAVIDGHGMELQDAAGGSRLLKPFEPYEFDGEARIHGALPSGPVSDLNVIFRPGAVGASLTFSSGAQSLHPGPDQTVLVIGLERAPFVLVAEGRELRLAHLDGVLATSGARLELPAGQRRAVIECAPQNQAP